MLNFYVAEKKRGFPTVSDGVFFTIIYVVVNVVYFCAASSAAGHVDHRIYEYMLSWLSRSGPGEQRPKMVFLLWLYCDTVIVSYHMQPNRALYTVYI